MLSARQGNFLPTFGFTNRVSYNGVSTSVVWNQWKNQGNVQSRRFQLIGQSELCYLKCRLEKKNLFLLFLKDIRSTDFLLTNWEAAETDLSWGRTLWASHIENQEEVLRRLIFYSHTKDNCSHWEINFQILSSADNYQIGN